MYKFLLLIMVGMFSCQSGLNKVVLNHENGSVQELYYITKAEQKKQGEYKRFYETGELEELAFFENDRLTGVRTIFSPDGKEIIKETHVNGLYHGLYESYFDNGEIEQKGSYIKNSMSGIWEIFYPNGQLKESVTFSDNEENGPFKEFYENGIIKAAGEYKDGDNEHGILMLYDSTGVLVRKMNCDMGKCHTIAQINN
jgi:antitoxin component YwqK of YwqJK toxin-antitoxin module